MTAKEEAFERLMKAAKDYNDLCPSRPEPTDASVIEPTVKHCAPSSFGLGCNMYLDAGGNMPGKIPVVVVPARVEDLQWYKRFRSAQSLRRALQLEI